MHIRKYLIWSSRGRKIRAQKGGGSIDIKGNYNRGGGGWKKFCARGQTVNHLSQNNILAILLFTIIKYSISYVYNKQKHFNWRIPL